MASAPFAEPTGEPGETPGLARNRVSRPESRAGFPERRVGMPVNAVAFGSRERSRLMSATMPFAKPGARGAGSRGARSGVGPAAAARPSAGRGMLRSGPVVLLVACALAFGGCSQADGASSPGGGSSRRGLRLADGSIVSLPEHPQRIVPSSAGLVDFLCTLVGPERLAGIPAQARAYSGLRDPGNPYLARPSFEAFTAESVLALKPDLVLCSRWQLADTAERLREAGVPVVLVDASERLDEIIAAFRLVAQAVGEEALAERRIAELDARVAALHARDDGRSRLRAVVYTNGGTGGWIAGEGTTAHEFLELAGLMDAAAEAGWQGHATASYEDLLRLDPDVIVVSRPDNPDEHGATARLLDSEPSLASLSAVRKGCVIELPSWLFSSTSQHVVTAAEALQIAVEARRGVAGGLAPEPLGQRR